MPEFLPLCSLHDVFNGGQQEEQGERPRPPEESSPVACGGCRPSNRPESEEPPPLLTRPFHHFAPFALHLARGQVTGLLGLHDHISSYTLHSQPMHFQPSAISTQTNFGYLVLTLIRLSYYFSTMITTQCKNSWNS